MSNTHSPTDYAAYLSQLGLTAAADTLTAKADLKRRLAIAYEHYRYVTKEQITAYRDTLKAATYKNDGLVQSFARLQLTPLDKYPNVPPKEALDVLSVAVGRACFNSFSIAHIDHVREPIPDPILFGHIDGCDDSFFIAEWGDDVRIADLLGEGDG